MKRLGFFVLPALCVGTSLASAQVTFDPPSDIAVATRPEWTAVGDFDGDNDNDMAVSADNPDRVVLLINGGAGSFGVGASILVGSGSGPHAVVAANLDGDTDVDLAVTLANSNSVQILINNGSGGFSAAGSIATSAEPRDMVSGDLDGDGDTDLACVCRSGNAVTILLNDGTGGFSSSSMTVGMDPRGLDLANFDADGDLDLAVSAHDDRAVEIYSNSGSATFSLARTLSDPNDRPSFVEAADLTNDGLPEIITTSGDFAKVFTNVGSFNFQGPAAYAVGMNPSAVVAGDFDVDGDRDLVTVDQDSNAITILQNTGSGSFASGGSIGVGTSPQHVAAYDLDGNNSLDIAVTNRDSDAVSFFRNANDGTQVAAATSRNGTGVNTLCYTHLTLPILGQSFDTEVAHGAHPGAVATVIVYKTQAVTTPTNLGEILIGGPKLLRDLVLSSGTADLHSRVIPTSVSLAGVTAATQAVIIGGGVELCNAIDLVVGF